MTDLSLKIDYPKANVGWISCYLIIDGEQNQIAASNVFHPFLNLLYFVKAVAGQRLLHSFFWHEEGTPTWIHLELHQVNKVSSGRDL
jgi:hypothetical protein